MPRKHLKLSESILGLSAFVLRFVTQERTFDDIYEYIQDLQSLGEIPSKHGMDNIILALNFLYSIDSISLQANGGIVRI